MADSFPRQQARTQGFSLGVPRSFQISPDGSRVAFLRSQGGDDAVTCLWVLDASTGQERLAADPAKAGSPGGAMTDAERAIRERTRERAGGITGFAADAALTACAAREHAPPPVFAAELALAGTTSLTPGAARTIARCLREHAALDAPSPADQTACLALASGDPSGR